MLKMKMFLLLLSLSGIAHADPVLTLGKSENYCVTTCYIRVPFTLTGYESTRKIGMVYCEVDSEITSYTDVVNGDVGIRRMQQSPIGVFKITPGKIKGDVEVDTGIRKKDFRDAKVLSASCHL